MFGATEYACSVDMWSIGTIMVELLLGHGADPTLKTKAGDAPITLVHPEQRQIRSLIGDAAGRRFAH